IELQPRILVPCMPSAIGHKLAVTRYRRPLRQAVLHMVQQYLRDRYLEAIRFCIGWNLHCVEQLLEGRGLLRSGHVALKDRLLLVRQQTNDVRWHVKTLHRFAPRRADEWRPRLVAGAAHPAFAEATLPRDG